MVSEKQDIHAIFNEAIVLASEEDRLRYLDQACGGDLQMRARVDALLHAHSEAGDFFGGKSAVDATKILPITEHPGTVIGPYKLLAANRRRRHGRRVHGRAGASPSAAVWR